jgi:hypothetical protein
MQRGCVNNFPISEKIARERSALSPIDSNSDASLRLSWTADFGSATANAAESTVAAEIEAIKQNERTSIAASPQIRKVSATSANLFRPEGNAGIGSSRASERTCGGLTTPANGNANQKCD